MQIDQSSLQVVQQFDNLDELQRVEEDIVRRVTSASFRPMKMTKRTKWTTEMTEKFYEVFMLT